MEIPEGKILDLKRMGLISSKKRKMSPVSENSRIQQIFEKNCNDRRNGAANTGLLYEINVEFG